MATKETKPKTTVSKPKATKGIPVKIKVLDGRAVIPEIKTEGSACFDLSVIESYHVKTHNGMGGVVKMRTGLAFEIPKGYHMEVYIRSSIACKTSLRLANSVGIIDSDYRGEVCLLVENVARQAQIVDAGARIAQARIVKDEEVSFSIVKELSQTKRGEGGFGSTN